MRQMPVYAIFVVGALAVPLFARPARGELLAVEGERLMTIDEATARTSVIAEIQGYFMGCLALHPSGTLYAAAWLMGPDQVYLATIDLETAAATRGPALSFTPHALAFGPDGTLFATAGTPNTALLTIDRESGARTTVGWTGLPGVGSLAFAPDGTLYAWDTGDLSGEGGIGLITIDPLSGVASDVNATLGAPERVNELAFAPDGTLYGGFESLYAVDVNTGELTLVGAIQGPSYGITGMVWIPEPSTLAALVSLAATAVLACLWRRIRRLPGTRMPALT